MKSTKENTKYATERRHQVKRKITKLLGDCECLPKRSEERFQAFEKVMRVVYDEYVETCKPGKHSNGAGIRRCSPEVMAAVKAVVGGEQDDRFGDVDEHPGSLDLL